MKTTRLIAVVLSCLCACAGATENSRPGAAPDDVTARCNTLQTEISGALDKSDRDHAAGLINQFDAGCSSASASFRNLAQQYRQRLSGAPDPTAAALPRRGGSGAADIFRQTVDVGGKEPPGYGSEHRNSNAAADNGMPPVIGFLSAVRPAAPGMPSLEQTAGRQMAVLEAVRTSSPQELLAALGPELSDSLRRNPGVVKKLAALDVLSANSTQEALAILQPILTDAASRNPKYAAQMTALSLLVTSSPQEAFTLVKPLLATAAGNNPALAKKLAVLEILTGNSPQEIVAALKTALAEATINNPSLARKLEAIKSLQNITAQDALEVLKPALLTAAASNPALAKRLTIVEALAAAAPDEALAIMGPVLTDTAIRRLTAAN